MKNIWKQHKKTKEEMQKDINVAPNDELISKNEVLKQIADYRESIDRKEKAEAWLSANDCYAIVREIHSNLE